MKNEIILSVLQDVSNDLYGLSDEFIACATVKDSPYYDDACKIVNARYTLTRLFSALQLVSDYAKE